ncbi:MAG: hypothetical protein KJ709_08720 [Nanoarchaeota archaeon]|nr:hypothetical protein [Nanoarchaeota archaeon]
MFIRLKKINGQLYAYRVRNTWTKKGARQKSVKYLGKALELDKPGKLSFEEFLKKYPAGFIEEAELKQIIAALVSWELQRRGFKAKEGFVKGDVNIQLNKLQPEMNGKPLIIKMGEGYLCAETIKALLSFRQKEEDPETAGMRLANSFISAGIQVPKEVFVKVFEKCCYFEEPEVETSLKNFE